MNLKPDPNREGLFIGTKSDGKSYSVRKDRHRYFFPEEWLRFQNQLKENRKILFETLLQTGGRIDEVLHLKPKDFIWDNNSVTLRVTKSKAKKGESKILGGSIRSRSEEHTSELQSHSFISYAVFCLKKKKKIQ